MAEGPQAVRIICPACAERYSGVVHESCHVCGGVGVLAVAVPEGVEPWVAARAATLRIGWPFDPHARDRVAEFRASVLWAPVKGSRGLGPDPHGAQGHNGVGRAAGRLVRSIWPPEAKPRNKRTPSERKSAAERRAEKLRLEEQQRVRREAWVLRKAAAEARRLDAQARGRVYKVLAELHPEMAAELFESERALARMAEPGFLPTVEPRDLRPWGRDPGSGGPAG